VIIYGDHFSRGAEGMLLSGLRKVVQAVEFDACIDIVKKGLKVKSKDVCFNDMTMKAGTERLKNSIVDLWKVGDHFGSDYPYMHLFFDSKDNPNGIPMPEFPPAPVKRAVPLPFGFDGPVDGFAGGDRYPDDRNAGAAVDPNYVDKVHNQFVPDIIFLSTV
jgi:hypothetical protein